MKKAMINKNYFQSLSFIAAVFLGYGLGNGNFSQIINEKFLGSQKSIPDLNGPNYVNHQCKTETDYEHRQPVKKTIAKERQVYRKYARKKIPSQNSEERQSKQKDPLYLQALVVNVGDGYHFEKDTNTDLSSPELAFSLAEKQFEDEFTQSQWGSDLEQEIESIFFKMQLNGSQIIDANCRSTLCRIEMDFEDIQVESDFIHGTAALMQNSIQYKAFQRLENADGTITRVMFLTSENNA